MATNTACSGPGPAVTEGEDVLGLEGVGRPGQHRQRRRVGRPAVPGSGPPHLAGAGAVPGDRRQGPVLEQAAGAQAVETGLAQGVVVIGAGGDGVHRASGVADGEQGGHQHPVLRDVVGPGRGGTDVDVVAPGAGGPARERLRPEHRAPQLAAALLGLVAHRDGQRPDRVRGDREQVFGLRAGGQHRPGQLLDHVGGQAQDRVHGLHHVERAAQEIPELVGRRALARSGLRVQPRRGQRGQSASSTPRTSPMVRWTSACSGGSNRPSIVR